MTHIVVTDDMIDPAMAPLAMLTAAASGRLGEAMAIWDEDPKIRTFGLLGLALSLARHLAEALDMPLSDLLRGFGASLASLAAGERIAVDPEAVAPLLFEDEPGEAE